ncbi:AzlC family ABC transporter permease [Ferrimonas futtsuensis]|uniref:AzlC family ABC transporter permease n=1 Tax=Ferrimonas futtsuensis TaxID=364764 RepID=UPI0004898C60|nr:AzlC family ABC transporter permease [Ferrimonas futtsuensis]
MSQQPQAYRQVRRRSQLLKGALAMSPLTLAVLPWGLLVGSLAMDAGLSPLQSQGLSAIIFAGAAQIAIIGLLKTGAGVGAILATTALITSRHLLYSMTMRRKVSVLSLKWRLTLGFLLTDELFAIAHPGKEEAESPWYMLGGGLSFYLGWNLATLAGVLLSQQLHSFDTSGLDFAIAAIFIALVTPGLRRRSHWICVLVAMPLAVLAEALAWPMGLLIASLSGMVAGAVFANLTGETLMEDKG